VRAREESRERLAVANLQEDRALSSDEYFTSELHPQGGVLPAEIQRFALGAEIALLHCEVIVRKSPLSSEGGVD
jgi:hypothetical protein